jgi:hypothetical protein
LFDRAMGLGCGGEAEDAWLDASGLPSLRLVERFASGPRRWISIYEADAQGSVQP